MGRLERTLHAALTLVLLGLFSYFVARPLTRTIAGLGKPQPTERTEPVAILEKDGSVKVYVPGPVHTSSEWPGYSIRELKPLISSSPNQGSSPQHRD